MEEQSMIESTTMYEFHLWIVNARRKTFHSHDFHDGILMSSRHLTLIIPPFTNSYLSFFLFLLYSFFFVLFGYELECERLVPITMYGDENKDG